jgi:deazaflavin-dependent oxidoreductase (nitroreductase family)
MASTEAKPWTPTQERFGTLVIRAMTAVHVWFYRLTGGRFGRRFPGGAPVCLVTTRGRRSGQNRTVALLYLHDGNRVVLVGSKGGMSHHPGWIFNLRAEPRCEVQIGAERRWMRARSANAEERAALWPRLVAMYPDYAEYQKRTTRQIAVLICEPE